MKARSFKYLCLAACALQALSGLLRAEIQLPPFFANGMVLQRDGAAPVWGKSAPGEKVTLQLNNQTITATADSQGNWKAAFQALAAGGPFTLKISGASQSITLNDVLVGDIWLCSGQSNMAYTLGQMGELGKDDIAHADDPLLHWFGPKNYIVDDYYAGRQWTPTSPSNASGNSAVAYFFAENLRKKLNIPIGVLSVSFPGSSIEGWYSPNGFAPLGMEPEMEALTQEYNNQDAATLKFFADLNAWETKYGRQDSGNKGFSQGLADPKSDASDWKKIANIGDWAALGVQNGGVVWVRKAVDIPAGAAGKSMDLAIGDIRNSGKEFGKILGTVYVNDREVGTVGNILKHIYTSPDAPIIKIPENLLVSGPNLIAIRFFTQEANAPWHKTDVTLRPSDHRIPAPVLSPDWLAKVEAVLPALPKEAAASRPVAPPSPPLVRLPSFFFNCLLKPLVGYGIKGVVWYQGEANTDIYPGAVPSVLGNNPAFAYRKLLPGLIADWRKLWNRDDMPFYIVQLPNAKMNDTPNGQFQKSSWAALRESQLLTWKNVPNTGMAVTVDVGDGNLHPPNKKPMGQRLAQAALANTYGQKGEFSGPIYDSMMVDGNKIRLKFTHAGSGLVLKSGTAPSFFAIAGADQKFVSGEAVVDGDSLVVSSPNVAAPAAVRYAWADNPIGCNLYNKEGLPASPFRTDDWPLR